MNTPVMASSPIVRPPAWARRAQLRHCLGIADPSGSILKRTYSHMLDLRSTIDLIKRNFRTTTTEINLMTIPPELRLVVFDYLLKPDNVYVRWSSRAASYDVRFAHIVERHEAFTPDRWLVDPTVQPKQPAKPTSAATSLFLVCRQLRDEAMQYYLAHNTFHIMGLDGALPYLS